MTASNQDPMWPPKGRRLISALLLACPATAIGGLILGFYAGASWSLVVAMQVPFAASIVYLLRRKDVDSTAEERIDADGAGRPTA